MCFRIKKNAFLLKSNLSVSDTSLLSQYHTSVKIFFTLHFTLSKIFIIIIFEVFSHLTNFGEEITYKISF